MPGKIYHGRIRLFAHRTTSLSLIWGYWTSKMLVRYILHRVCLRLSQLSSMQLSSNYQLSSMQYTGLCVFSLPISLIMIVRLRVLFLRSIIKSEVWLICHCLGLGHETMGICLFVFFWYTCNQNKTTQAKTVHTFDGIWYIFGGCGEMITTVYQTPAA